mmetsp:Transcript_3163/g.6866  ORF Transcript_3163/g.6866 Transcript_3163/m.6866 type:complete len:95 (+) Transcript_3163:8-292(+)
MNGPNRPTDKRDASARLRPSILLRRVRMDSTRRWYAPPRTHLISGRPEPVLKPSPRVRAETQAAAARNDRKTTTTAKVAAGAPALIAMEHLRRI